MSALRLGALDLSSRFILSPMESVSDAAFRRLCWQQGAAFTWTEMVRARGLTRNNRSTWELIDPWDADVPIGVQHFSSRTGTGEKTQARTSVTCPVASLRFKGSHVVPLGHDPSLQQRSAQMPSATSQMPPRHSADVAHACPDTFAALEARHDGWAIATS